MASRNSLSSLESLPVELLQMILAQMNSRGDLDAATKASNRLAEAFAGYREPILITVIQSNLDKFDPSICKWMLGVIRVPVYRDLAYVANSPRLEAPEEPDMWAASNDWHEACRQREIRRLATDFSHNEMSRIASELSNEAIDSFPVPCLSRAGNAEQRAEHKRIIDEVETLYDELHKLRNPNRRLVSPFPSLKDIRAILSQRRYALFLLSDSLPSKW